MSLNFISDNPINISSDDNDIKINLNLSDIVNDGKFVGESHHYTNNINGISIDKYGRVIGVETGVDIVSPNEISYLKINNNDYSYNLQLTKNPETTHTLTINTDDKLNVNLSNNVIELKLNETGVVNKDNVSFDIKTTNVSTNGFSIKKLTDNNYTNTIDIYKGKTYIFKQNDATSTESNNNLSLHAIGVSKTEHLIEAYSNVEYYINDDGVIYNYNEYRLKFINRNINSNPYFKFKLPNDFESNVLYFYSPYSNTQQKITVNIKDVIETKTFKDIKDMTIDNHGRIIEISQNEIPLMSKFNINLNDNNIKSIINGDNLNLLGFDGHINTKLVDNNIILKLTETGIINSLGILPNEFYIVIHDNTVKKNNTLSLDVNDYITGFFEVHSGYEYIFHQKINNYHPIKIVIDEFAYFDYTDNVEYYSYITNKYVLVTLDAYRNNINIGKIGYIKLKTNTNTPKKLYLSSANNPNTNIKMSINTNIYTKQFDGVLSITTDQYGRLHDISTIDEINDVSFTVLISDYTVFSFSVSEQRALLEGFVYYFLNIEFNNIFINNIVQYDTDIISINIKITKISTDKANNIETKINNLKNNDDFKNIFKSILTNVKKMINFNDILFIDDFVITLVDNNSIYINNFTIRADDSDINIKNMSILEFNTDDGIINISADSNNKKITFDLNKLKDNTDTYINNIKEITVDKYGRITDVKTGYIELPDSGVTSNDEETFLNGISSITVNSKGIISNIETVDYISIINTGDELLNDKINNYVSDNNTIVNKLKNDFNLYVSNNNSQNIINKSDIQSNINSITNEILRATLVEGDINLLNTNNKNSLVEAINHLNNIINDYVTYNNSNIKKLDIDLKNEILSISNVFASSLNNLNNILEYNTESIEKIGNLDYYDNIYTLISFLGNLSNIKSTGTLDEQINKIGLLDNYTSNNTLIDDVNNIIIKNKFIFDDDINTIIKSYSGHKNLFSILGFNNNNSEKYSYGPSSLSQAVPFYRDGFYPLFTTLENMSVWKNNNIIGAINKALSRTKINSIDYNNLLNFKNNFKDLSISPNEESDIHHVWENIQYFEEENHVYFTIGHNLFIEGKNPTITFTNKYNIQETITIEIDNNGNSKKNIINDIIKLEYKTKNLESNLEKLISSNNVFVVYFKKLVNSYVKFNKSDILSSNNINVYYGVTIINSNSEENISRRNVQNNLYVNSYIVEYDNTWIVPLNSINPTIIIDIDLSNFTDGFTLFFQIKKFKGNVDNLFTIISQEKNNNNSLHKTVYSITNESFNVNLNTARFDSDFKNTDTGINVDDKSTWSVFISFIPDLTTVTYNDFDEKIYESYNTQLIYKKSNSNEINYSKKLSISIHHFNKSWLLFGQSSNKNINDKYDVDNGINDIDNWVNGNVNSYNTDNNIDCNCDLSKILIFDKKIDIKDIYNFNKLNVMELEKLF